MIKTQTKTNKDKITTKNKNKYNNTTVEVSYHTSHNAITLIALVITIIILLVLVGVTLILTIGQGGLLEKSNASVSEYNKKEATEAMNLKITNIQIKSYTETQKLPNLQYLADRLCEDDEMEYVIKKEKQVASLDKIDVRDVTSIFTKIKKYPYEFEIDSELRLASIDGVKVATNQGYVKPEGTLEITENGEHDVTNYATAKVDVKIPEGYIKPSGVETISSNGTYNITDKEEVIVNVTTDKKYTQAEYDAKTVATTKTLLWTNNSPTSAMGDTTIQLNNSLENYTHIIVQWHHSTTNTTIYEDLFKLQPYRTTSNAQIYGLTGKEAPENAIARTRILRYVDSTHIKISKSLALLNTEQTTNHIIPRAIYGLKISY